MKCIKKIVVGISFFLCSPIFSSSLRFAWEAFKNLNQVGALFECSASVGHELMRYADNSQAPRKIIEIGAGMGSLSKVIGEYLRKDDRLDLIEINPQYCVHLRKLFPTKQFPNIHIHCTDILEFKPAMKYDFIICTLPFNAFPNGLVKNLHDQLLLFAKKGTYLSYVEYMVVQTLKRNLTPNAFKQQQLIEHKKLVDEFKNRYLLQTVKVYKNVPPIYVHHLKL